MVLCQDTDYVLLDEPLQRETAQGLLDYWANVLHSLGAPDDDATLADFDPLRAPELLDALCPYVGLDAFQQHDAEFFFGRSALIRQLGEHLEQQRLLALIGPSGGGKSSLVRAGLIPLLMRSAAFSSESWAYPATVIPGSNPLAALDAALTNVDPRKTPLVLVIDQFEETFLLCRDAQLRSAFLDRLTAFVQQPAPPHRVILTMRRDFVEAVGEAPAFKLLFDEADVYIPSLTAAELREAIEEPARKVGLKFEAGVIEQLVEELQGEIAALPLLQFTLRRLWDRRERNRVTLAAYNAIGGGREALEHAADELYDGLIPQNQETLRRILLRMVRPGLSEEFTSRRIPLSDLASIPEDPARVSEIVQKLVAARLVRLSPGESADDTQIEIAHEALIRNWKRLLGWLNDERGALYKRRELTTAADAWQRRGRPPKRCCAAMCGKRRKATTIGARWSRSILR
ncbi:hypothetical protein HC891_20390 [Candidatus Gracilibacteria bacterium]|nr:hypothetical protein [Candidatus Gracilibacteria bacterium]